MKAAFLSLLLILALPGAGRTEEGSKGKDATATAAVDVKPEAKDATATAAADVKPEAKDVDKAEAKDEEIPAPPEGAKDTSGESAKMALPKAEEKIEVPSKEFVWKPKAKGFPLVETSLAALGGGLIGCMAGFFMSGDVNSNEYKYMGRDISIGGGVGLVAGGIFGFVFSHTDPPKLKPPEPTTSLKLDLSPRGPVLCLSTKW